MSAAEASDVKPERVAIIVTHGVGEAEPGQCMASLVQTLSNEPGVEVSRAAEVLLLPDRPRSDRTAEEKGPASSTAPSFPVLFREATVQDRVQLTFAELHWADLTRIGSGRIASMLGLFRVIFEAHYVIDAMLHPRLGWTIRALRFVLLWLSWLMRGPIVGFTVATAAVFWAALYARPHGMFGSWSPQLLFASVLAAVFLASLLLRVWSEKRWDATWRTSLNWMLIVSGLFCLVSFTAPSRVAVALFYPLNFTLSLLTDYGFKPVITKFPEFTERHDFVNLHYRNLMRLWVFFGTVWIFGALTLLAVIGIAAWRKARTRARFTPALAATGILTLQLALWTALVGTAVLPLLNRAQEVIAVTTVRPIVETGTSVSNNEEVKRLLDVAEFPKDAYAWVARLVFAYGFNGLIVILVILVGACVFLIRTRMAENARGEAADDLFATAQRLPRVLFNWPLMTVLIVLTLVQLVFNIMFSAETHQGVFAKKAIDVIGYLVSKDKISDLKQWADHAFAQYINSTMFLAWALALVFPLLMGNAFNNAVHIARDLIDHQYGPERGRVLTARRDRRLTDALRWPRRERIRQRLLQVLAALGERGPYDRIIFLAHSQGSVVVYDYLKGAADYASSRVGGTKPDVITFGSPLGHIYQHYFQEYAGLDAAIDRLAQCTGRWINLYRIDDYIGLWVGSPGERNVENRPMDPGGHVDYWKESALAKAIIDVVADGASRDGRAQSEKGPALQYTGETRVGPAYA